MVSAPSGSTLFFSGPEISEFGVGLSIGGRGRSGLFYSVCVVYVRIYICVSSSPISVVVSECLICVAVKCRVRRV